MNMYDSSVPALITALTSLSGILKSGAAHAKAKNIDESVFLNARLAPDMFALTRQVQIATDMATRGIARLVGEEPSSTPDTETDMKALQARIKNAIKTIKSYKRAQFDDKASAEISMKLPIGTLTLSGAELISMWVIPNVHFHVITAYHILRHNGVELTKRDFLGDGIAARMTLNAQSKPATEKSTKKSSKKNTKTKKKG